MNQLDKTTRILYDNINGGNEQRVFIDPATILMVTSIIVNVVKLVQQCKTYKEAKESVDTPTAWERHVVYRQIRKQLPWRDYFNRTKQQQIADAIFQTGSNMTEEDMQQLFEDVNKG